MILTATIIHSPQKFESIVPPMREFATLSYPYLFETQTQIVASHFFSSRIVVVLPWPDGSKADGTSSIMNCNFVSSSGEASEISGDEKGVSLSGEAIC